MRAMAAITNTTASALRCAERVALLCHVGHRARNSGQQLLTGNGQRHTPAVTLVAVWGAAYQCCALTQL